MKERYKKIAEMLRDHKLIKAEKECKEILADNPKDDNAYHLLGLIKNKAGDTELSIEHFRKAIDLNGKAAPYFYNLASALRVQGDMEGAKESYEASISIKPDYAEVYQGMVEAKAYDDPDELLERINNQLKRKLPDRQKSFFHFAAGKLCNDSKQYDNAFKHYDQANKRSGRKFDMNLFRTRAKDTLFVYSKDFLKKRLESIKGLENDNLIFIVGMPRSGSTLLETILHSHKDVFGCGELPDIQAITGKISSHTKPKVVYPLFMPALNDEMMQGFAQSYIKRVEGMADKPCTHYVDKQLMNFQFIGFILEMFPNAKILHSKRHPLDCCLSQYFLNFSNGIEFSFNLRVLTDFYKLYMRMMEHWQDLYGDRILTVNYEDNVADQEGNTRKILEYCGLPWDDAVLEFNKTKRTVKTASFWQVRQGIYSSSVGRWKNYKKYLGPLVELV
ncbi:MAG: sulfotransferase [Lentisphaeria bacterium]|nr:sulfotransferase [Lentisphaeria bacterium]NQZ70951.1 sulfotransferase [Lentisphaeria bacterium]